MLFLLIVFVGLVIIFSGCLLGVSLFVFGLFFLVGFLIGSIVGFLVEFLVGLLVGFQVVKFSRTKKK